MGVRMAPEVVTEGSGWHEEVADRAECGVGYAGTGRDRRSAVAELGKRVAAAEAAFGLPGVTVVRRRLSVHDQWRGNRVVGCRATEDVGLRLDDVTALQDVLAALVRSEPADLNGPTWLLADPTAARRTAQQRAVADARDAPRATPRRWAGGSARCCGCRRRRTTADRRSSACGWRRPRPRRRTSASWAWSPSRCG